MTRTVQDVKVVIHSIMDKFVGNSQEPFTKDEYETLVFAFESNILFDNVAQKFLPSLKAVPEVPELVLTGEETEEELKSKQDERSALLKERDNMIKAVLLTVFKENIFREMRIRFGA